MLFNNTCCCSAWLPVPPRSSVCCTSLGFTPVVAEGGDALARLRIRMEEIMRSLSLVRTVADASQQTATTVRVDRGSGEATVETPRGIDTTH